MIFFILRQLSHARVESTLPREQQWQTGNMKATRSQAVGDAVAEMRQLRRSVSEYSTNGVARIILGGGQFSVISGGRPDSVGGGVVAEIFRDRRKPGRFSGGGGVVAEIFRDRRKPGRFSGGGG